MHLIQEVQDHAKPLVVHAHLLFEIADEVCARQIHLREGQLAGGAGGDGATATGAPEADVSTGNGGSGGGTDSGSMTTGTDRIGE